MIIDSHLHIIDRKAIRYSWLEGAGILNRDSLYADYAAEAKRVGISGVVHMEVDVEETDIDRETDYVQALSREPGSLLIGATASCRPENADFADALERAVANPFIKGLRRVLHVMPDELSESALFRSNIKRMENTRLTFDLVMKPGQIAQTLALVDHAPGVTFILDHCGVPDIAGGDFSLWSKGIDELAKRPNLIGKISGVMAYTDLQNWTLADIQPYVEHIIDRFGWDRVIWGSDHPVCTLGGSLSTWVAATHMMIEGCSTAEKAALLAGNARRIWALR
jgi:predicted TIM-barrel fold metal-dependent hydrolase